MNGKQKGYISTHTPHAGRDEFRTLVESLDENFYSHAPCGARPAQAEKELAAKQNFYSHAPCGARRDAKINDTGKERFLLTRPMRGATEHTRIRKQTKTISTHTPHAGRDEDIVVWSKGRYISTHTPHAGRDDRPDCRAMDGK